MKLIEGILAILPGDKDFGYAPFNQDMLEILKKNSTLWEWAEENFISYIDNQDINAEYLSLMEGFFIYLKKKDSIKFKQFRFDLIETYFKSNQHKGASARPPNDPENVIILEDIEFDLLEPVLERGPIWRIVDNEEE